jgi:hypothetical protein
MVMALITVFVANQAAMADEESGQDIARPRLRASAGPVAGAIKGTVILKGEPLEKGRIFFHIGNDQFVGAKIKNGEFSVDKVPVGDWKVTVEGDGVPAVYTFDVQTPLKVAVTKDSQTFQFSLKRR